jgi:membrane-bound ClpP family serine protease
MTFPASEIQSAAYFAGVAVVAATLIVLVWGAVLKSKREDNRIGQSWGSEHVKVVEWSDGEGYVDAGGERWRAKSRDLLSEGDAVRVMRTKGLVLEVGKIQQEQGD